MRTTRIRRALEAIMLEAVSPVRTPSEWELQLVDGRTRAHAFSQLFRQSVGVIVNRLERIGWRREEAEEIARDAFESAWRTVSTFDPARGSFVTWMTQIARTKGWNRRRARRPEVAFSQIDGNAELGFAEPAERADLATDTVDLREVAARVFQIARRSLTPKQRRVLFLRYKRGLGVSAIASELDTTDATVRSMLSKSIRKLEASLFF